VRPARCARPRRAVVPVRRRLCQRRPPRLPLSPLTGLGESGRRAAIRAKPRCVRRRRAREQGLRGRRGHERSQGSRWWAGGQMPSPMTPSRVEGDQCRTVVTCDRSADICGVGRFQYFRGASDTGGPTRWLPIHFVCITWAKRSSAWAQPMYFPRGRRYADATQFTAFRVDLGAAPLSVARGKMDIGTNTRFYWVTLALHIAGRRLGDRRMRRRAQIRCKGRQPHWPIFSQARVTNSIGHHIN
jgi:hypothetical protein